MPLHCLVVKRTGELGSVHYDERLVCDFWKELTESADATSSSFTVDHNSSSTEFETPEELQNATQIPDRITEFELSVIASEGKLRISASSQGHQYIIRGEENWVRRMSDYIRDFSSERENKLRTILTNDRIRQFRFFIIGGLAASFWNKITALVLPFYYVELSQTQQYIFIGLIVGIVLLQIGKYIYPPVEFRRRGSQKRTRKILFILTLIGSIASILQGLYWVFV
jgi:hypothetical protein